MDGDKESKEAFEKFYPLKRHGNDVYSNDLPDIIIDECMSDGNIAEALNTPGSDVQGAATAEGAHGHDTYGVIFVR